MGTEMTDYQFSVCKKMIIQIVKDSESKEDAVEKIEALIGKDKITD